MDLTLDERSRLDFVLTLRRRWSDTVYPALQAQVDADGDVADMRAAAHRQPGYPWFAFLERTSQKMLWRDVTDAVTAHPSQGRGESKGPATLTLDPQLQLPAWYTDWDIHLQPGGVWRDDRSADVYELGAKLVMLGDNDDYTFHRAFTETAVPQRDYRRIVDLGCGFGKSAWPLKRRFPDAEVIGVDLAAPCLRLAHDRANAAGLGVDFRQADCQSTGLADASVDLVTSTMLIHEIPRPALIATLAEAMRILAPGGLLRFLDFTRTGDAFRDLAMMEHGERNNEPFMPGSLSADLPALCTAAGFRDARWVAFDERGAGRLPAAEWPERAEWHFPWAVLEAEKPA
ncbi:class I SAM-dependent methyltransferase [Sphingomonas sp. AOB5]|uniref:class I SAM-dependent methyltransferase n=1 Tax=Sphingomonas sp. AOB5 TaxID=3034017 RepID=UPI0023F717ED|nr:class I SAM-dependent methyltransferase [Sphingomonas sp. AOB5]MDF7775539.1 class I SAM-dependent methyltransferase [Sphingomonas sp. AOB5]